MSVFGNLRYLSEEADNELKLQIDSDTDGIASAIAKEFEQIETLEKNVFEYNAPMIPIIQKPTQEGTKYVVEFDMLNKLAKDQDVDVCEAFNMVCAENAIDADDLYIFLRGSIAKCVTESVTIHNARNVKKALKTIRAFKENGINLLREEEEVKPEGVDMDGIPTDPDDDTVNTIQDNEGPSVVKDLDDTSEDIAGM